MRTFQIAREAQVRQWVPSVLQEDIISGILGHKRGKYRIEKKTIREDCCSYNISILTHDFWNFTYELGTNLSINMAGVQLNQTKVQAKMVSIPEVSRQHLASTLLSHKTTERYLKSEFICIWVPIFRSNMWTKEN